MADRDIKPENVELRCFFCLKTRREVAYLVQSGVTTACVCNECIGQAVELIAPAVPSEILRLEGLVMQLWGGLEVANAALEREGQVRAELETLRYWVREERAAREAYRQDPSMANLNSLAGAFEALTDLLPPAEPA